MALTHSAAVLWRPSVVVTTGASTASWFGHRAWLYVGFRARHLRWPRSPAQVGVSGAKDGADEPPAGSGRNAERSFRGENRGNETQASTTDPDARLYRKADGQPSRLRFMGHLLIENRHGLIVDVRITHATGRAEREAAEAMIEAATRGRWVTLGCSAAIWMVCQRQSGW